MSGPQESRQNESRQNESRQNEPSDEFSSWLFVDPSVFSVQKCMHNIM